MTLVANIKAEPPRVPLRLRLKAWWEGSDLVVHQREAASSAVPNRPARPIVGKLDPARPWETRRIILSQMLWGEGFSLPGGAEEALRLAKPFALDPAMTVIDLNAGLGGGARAIVERFGVWVAGYELDRELAAAGMQLSIRDGLGKKAEIVVYRPDQLEIRPASIDCVMCRELLHRVSDKPALLQTINQGLKPKGQLVMTDYMLSDPERAGNAPVRTWLDGADGPVELWSADQYTRALGAEKLEVRVTEDISVAYRRMVLAGWAGLTRAIGGASVAPELARCLVKELERWMRLVAAIDSGDLQVVRIYALKAGSKMLSDW